MKRMHLHVAVENLNQSISFYSNLFGAPPTVTKEDYAKWMLEDPKVNFAISDHSTKIGLDHIGIQVDSDTELSEIKTRLDAAEMTTVSQEGTTCCYSQSDKHWVQDPSGIAWETYNTLDSSPTFNDRKTEASTDSACCAPTPPTMQPVQIISKPKGCC